MALVSANAFAIVHIVHWRVCDGHLPCECGVLYSDVLLAIWQVDVAGSMHFWGLTIDTVTTIILILAIGLAVDYSAHVGHMFMTVTGTRAGQSQTGRQQTQTGRNQTQTPNTDGQKPNKDRQKPNTDTEHRRTETEHIQAETKLRHRTQTGRNRTQTGRNQTRQAET